MTGTILPQLRRLGALAVSMLLATVAVAGAQNVGTVTGTVKDPQGLAIPGASVTLLNRISQTSQETISAADGQYVLANVPFGIYVLTAHVSGFAPAQEVVDVHSTVPMTVALQLRVGTVSETVEVSADALLETSSTGSHVDLSAALIDRMPTATPTRQLSGMLLSAPGFIPSQNGRIHVRGSHGQIQYIVDGVPMTDEYTEAYANPLDPRYVKSAAVMTGGIPAEYGRKLGAVVDITSRSGLDDPRKATGTASLNVGRFGAVDGGATVGGRVTSRLGYFVSGGGNRTDRYLDPPTADNFNNSGDARRFTGKLEVRPSDNDFVRAVVSVNGSDFHVANRQVSQALGVDSTQSLRDNSQTVTWLRQFGRSMTLDAQAYRRGATATLDASSAVPLGAEQDRSLDHQGVNAALSYASGKHRVKAGVQYDRNPVRERFRMAGTGASGGELEAIFGPAQIASPFVFNGSKVGQNVGLFVQDSFSPVEDLHLNIGVRYDSYRMIVDESAVSPRLGVAYHLHDSGTVLRGSYSRIFMPPFSENLLLSSSEQARALATNGDPGVDVTSERQHAYEVGVQQAFSTRAKIDVAYYRKNIRNLADVEQFFDTTVTFPISVAKGLAEGVEARLDVPVYRGVNGYLSVSRARILLTAPLTGGLFLEDVPEDGEQFYADHDQQWQMQFGATYQHPTGRFALSATGRFDSGIPFELPEDYDPSTFEDPVALTLIDIDRERAKPRVILDLLASSELLRRGARRLEVQAGVMNVFDTKYLLNFLSIFNGTHYGAPRTWMARLRVGF